MIAHKSGEINEFSKEMKANADKMESDARNNMELLRNVYGSQIHIFDNYIPFSVRMKEAVREGQSIFSYDPKGKATEAYRRVTEEVLKDAI